MPPFFFCDANPAHGSREFDDARWAFEVASIPYFSSRALQGKRCVDWVALSGAVEEILASKIPGCRGTYTDACWQVSPRNSFNTTFVSEGLRQTAHSTRVSVSNDLIARPNRYRFGRIVTRENPAWVRHISGYKWRCPGGAYTARLGRLTGVSDRSLKGDVHVVGPHCVPFRPGIFPCRRNASFTS